MQENPVYNSLKKAFEQGRFPQMSLLDGEKGIGKKLIAYSLANIICENSSESIIWLTPIDGKAEERDTPAKIEAKTLELSQKFIKNPFYTGYITESAIISVGMTEYLMEQLKFKAGGNRVVIITNADLINEQSANKLLKTFEEVPPNTYFILTAHSRHTLLPTIRSRATSFFVPFLNNEQIESILNNYGYTNIQESVLEFAAGSAGKAMLAIDLNYMELKEKIEIYADYALKGDASAAILHVQGIEKQENTTAFFLEGLALHLIRTCKRECSVYVQYIHFFLQAMFAKKITPIYAIQNLALRLTQKVL